jgi:hypothetical protein
MQAGSEILALWWLRAGLKAAGLIKLNDLNFNRLTDHSRIQLQLPDQRLEILGIRCFNDLSFLR